jgi:hypothetical protein
MMAKPNKEEWGNDDYEKDWGNDPEYWVSFAERRRGSFSFDPIIDKDKTKKERFQILFDGLAEYSKTHQGHGWPNPDSPWIGPDLKWEVYYRKDDPEISCIINWKGLVYDILNQSEIGLQDYEYTKDSEITDFHVWEPIFELNIMAIIDIGIELIRNEVSYDKEIHKICGFLRLYDHILDSIIEYGENRADWDTYLNYIYPDIRKCLYNLAASFWDLIVDMQVHGWAAVNEPIRQAYTSSQLNPSKPMAFGFSGRGDQLYYNSGRVILRPQQRKTLRLLLNTPDVYIPNKDLPGNYHDKNDRGSLHVIVSEINKWLDHKRIKAQVVPGEKDGLPAYCIAGK